MGLKSAAATAERTTAAATEGRRTAAPAAAGYASAMMMVIISGDRHDSRMGTGERISVDCQIKAVFLQICPAVSKGFHISAGFFHTVDCKGCHSQRKC